MDHHATRIQLVEMANKMAGPQQHQIIIKIIHLQIPLKMANQQRQRQTTATTKTIVRRRNTTMATTTTISKTITPITITSRTSNRIMILGPAQMATRRPVKRLQPLQQPPTPTSLMGTMAQQVTPPAKTPMLRLTTPPTLPAKPECLTTKHQATIILQA